MAAGSSASMPPQPVLEDLSLHRVPMNGPARQFPQNGAANLIPGYYVYDRVPENFNPASNNGIVQNQASFPRHSAPDFSSNFIGMPNQQNVGSHGNNGSRPPQNNLTNIFNGYSAASENPPSRPSSSPSASEIVFHNSPFDENTLSKCVLNNKLDIVAVGHLIISARNRGLDVESVIKRFIKNNFQRITGTVSSNELYRDEYGSAVFFGQLIMNRVALIKSEYSCRLANSRSLPTPIDLKRIQADIRNISTPFVVPSDLSAPFKSSTVIRMTDLQQPNPTLPLHQKVGHMLFHLMSKVTDPPEAIKGFTLRTRVTRYNKDSSESEEEEEEEEGGADETVVGEHAEDEAPAKKTLSNVPTSFLRALTEKI